MAEHQDAIEAIEAQKQRAFEKQQRAQRKYYIKNHPEITNETTLSNKYDNEIIKEITKEIIKICDIEYILWNNKSFNFFKQ